MLPRTGVVSEDMAGVEAVLGHPGHCLDVVAGVPERRVGLLEWLDPDFQVLVAVVLSLVVEQSGCGSLGEQVHLLVEYFPAVSEVDVELLCLHRRDSPAHTQVQASVAEVVQHAELVVQANGIVEGQQVHQWPQPQLRCALRRRRQEYRRRRGDAERRQVMLGQVIAMKPAAVGEFQHFQPVFENLVRGRLVPLDPVEQSEVQRVGQSRGLCHRLPPFPLGKRTVSRIIRRSGRRRNWRQRAAR